ncbi:MAG: hypothetical protein ACREAE_00445, partial [Nitrosopumilaceae archaeon]
MQKPERNKKEWKSFFAFVMGLGVFGSVIHHVANGLSQHQYLQCISFEDVCKDPNLKQFDLFYNNCSE